MVSASADNKHIRAVLQQIFAEAIAEGQSSVRVKAEDVHIAAGHAADIAVCCQVMVREMGRRDRIEATPPKGLGAGLIIRYALPRRIGGRLPRSFFFKTDGVMGWLSPPSYPRPFTRSA